MKIKYFKDTDTLYIIFNENKIIKTTDITETVLVDLDANQDLVSLTIEHAKEQTNISNFSVNMQPAIFETEKELV